MPCSCGVCQECNWAESHRDELDAEESCEYRLIMLSRAVADALYEYRDMEQTNSAPRSGYNALEALDAAYREYGKQD